MKLNTSGVYLSIKQNCIKKCMKMSLLKLMAMSIKSCSKRGNIPTFNIIHAMKIGQGLMQQILCFIVREIELAQLHLKIP